MKIISFEQLVQEVRTNKKHITSDSRTATRGSVFVALPPYAPQGNTNALNDNGHYIVQACLQGADIIVCAPEHFVYIEDNHCTSVKCCFHEFPYKALGILLNESHGATKLKHIIGITGTNGKTTIAHLLEHLFIQAKHSVGVLGTIAYRWSGHNQTAPLTTPSCTTLHDHLRKMEVAGADTALMEVSSHALDQGRTEGINFTGAIFTNLTQDHLDYHGTLENYFTAKSRLFTTQSLFNKALAINADNLYGRRLLKVISNATGYALGQTKYKNPGYVLGTIKKHNHEGLSLNVHYKGEKWTVNSPLIGTYNASNLLAAQALTLAVDSDTFTPKIFESFKDFTGIPGRLERIPNSQGLHVFVDYAHTPDALKNVLMTLSNTGFKRIIVVFGCGGDRDKTKRPIMGKMVSAFADIVIATSDNPRTEDPKAILADIKQGLSNAKRAIIEGDRYKAIEIGLELLGPEDALLVAGKGHEEYQIIGDKKIPFSDQNTIRELLQCE